MSGPGLGIAGAVAVAALISAIAFGFLPVPQAIIGCGLGWAMAVIVWSDARYFIVPDALSLPAIPAGLLASGFLLEDEVPFLIDPGHLAGAALGGAALGGLAWSYRRLRGIDGLGLGDVKLAAAGGAWVGVAHLPVVLLVASGSALTAVVFGRMRRGEPLDDARWIPLGAYLAPAIWLVWMALKVGYLD